MATTLQLDIENLNAQLNKSDKNTVINKITKSAQINQYSDFEIQTFLESNIIENDKFTKHLYVNIVNILKNEKLFIKLLKSEDDQLISDTIRKCIYFYGNEKYSPTFYSDDILPYISMTNRSLLIQTLARNLKNPERSELFFNHFNKIFGISVARPFLIFCSDDFIMEKLNKQILIANYYELQRLLIRNSKFVLNYLNRLIEINNDDKNYKIKIQLSLYTNLFYKLLGIHTRETFELIENNKDKINLKFGKKLTKKLLNFSKELILNDVKHYEKSLHKKIIIKNLSKQDFVRLFERLFPNFLKDFNQSMRNNGILYKYLDYCKTNEDKVNLLITSYKNVYRQELFDYSKNLTPDLLKLLSKQDRIKFAQKIIDNGDETYLKLDQWRCYLDCKIIIKSFKEQIQITPDSKLRQKFLVFMIESCGINDDYESLLDVLKYYNKRHRNELIDIRLNFIISINNNINMDKMIKEHWIELFEIFDVMSLNNEYRGLWQCEKLFLTQIKYYLINNLSIDKPIQIYIRWANDNKYGGKNKWTIFDKNSQWEKLCLQKFGELIPQNLPNNINTSAELYFAAISSWNERNPTDLLTIIDYQWVVNEITINLSKENQRLYHYNRLYSYFKYDPKACEYFGDKVPSKEQIFDIEKLDELIVNEPEMVQKNIDKITKYMVHREISQRQQHLILLLTNGKIGKIPELENAIHQECLDIINVVDADKIQYRSTALKLLVHWLNGNEFYDIARKNYPEEKIAKSGNKLAEYKFKFQATIIYLMKIYNNHPETFVALKKFCVGDFLKLSICTLISICLRSPVYKSLDFLNSCIDTPVSFRKHIIRLICRIGNKQFIYQFLQNLWHNEKNPSIRQVLLENIIQLFIAEPDDIKWNLVKECIENLTDKDQHSFETLNCFIKIPDNYLGNYIETCWLVLHKTKNDVQKELIALNRSIISQIGQNLNLMSIKFIETILTVNLFTNQIDISLHYSFSNLAIMYILNGPTDEDHKLRIDFVFTLLELVFKSGWNHIQYDDNDKPYFQTRKYIKYFLNDIILELLSDIKKYKLKSFLLSYLQSKLIEIIPDAWIYFYEELLQFEILKISTKSMNCFDFGRNLRNLLDDEIKSHGTYIIPIFEAALTHFGNMNKYFYMYQVCEGLLAEPIQSNECALLVLHLIPIENLYTPDYKSILDRLNVIENQNIKIILNKFIEGNNPLTRRNKNK